MSEDRTPDKIALWAFWLTILGVGLWIAFVFAFIL
jgi:uncharacterized membrane protein YhdT